MRKFLGVVIVSLCASTAAMAEGSSQGYGMGGWFEAVRSGREPLQCVRRAGFGSWDIVSPPARCSSVSGTSASNRAQGSVPCRS